MNAKLTLISAALLFSLNYSLGFATKNKELEVPDLLKICKKQCPEAKTSKEAHDCAEMRAKDSKTGEKFKKSKCWIENEKYDVMVSD